MRKFFIIMVGGLFLSISTFSAGRDYTQDELLAMRRGEFGDAAMMRLARKTQEKLKGKTPEEAEKKLSVLHEKLGTQDSLLQCIQTLEEILGSVEEGSLLNALRDIFSRLGEEDGILSLVERHRNSLGGEGNLANRILALQHLIGTDGVVISELTKTLSRMGFGGSLDEMIKSALRCIGGREESIFQSIVEVKKKLGGVGSLERRIQVLDGLVPGEGDLLTQVQSMGAELSSLREGEKDLEATIKKLTAQIETHEAQREEMDRDLASLRAGKTDLEAAVKRLTAQIETHEAQREEMDRELASLRAKNTDLEAKLEVSQGSTVRLTEALEVSEGNVEKAVALQNMLSLDKEELSKQVYEKEKDLERIRDHLSLSEKKSQYLQGLIRTSEQEKQKLGEDLEESRREIERMKIQLKVIQSEKKRLDDEVAILTKSIMEEGKRRDLLEAEFRSCREEKEKFSSALESSQAKNRELSERTSALTEEISSLMGSVQELTRQQKELERIVSNLKKEAKADQADIAAVIEINEQLERDAKQAVDFIGAPFSSLPGMIRSLGKSTIATGIGDIQEFIGVDEDLSSQAQEIFGQVLRLLDGGMTVQGGSLRDVHNLKGLGDRLLELSQVRSSEGSESELEEAPDSGDKKKKKKKKETDLGGSESE
ncbi:hypothetical protein OAN21_02775 [Alphaproteobacteria bacterium]|nr:hypothetical protein [Alphaproteobacteria bacterium]